MGISCYCCPQVCQSVTLTEQCQCGALVSSQRSQYSVVATASAPPSWFVDLLVLHSYTQLYSATLSYSYGQWWLRGHFFTLLLRRSQYATMIGLYVHISTVWYSEMKSLFFPQYPSKRGKISSKFFFIFSKTQSSHTPYPILYPHQEILSTCLLSAVRQNLITDII